MHVTTCGWCDAGEDNGNSSKSLQDESRIYQSLFHRTPDSRIEAISSGSVTKLTLEACAKRCVKGLHTRCKSFDYEISTHFCILFPSSVNDSDARLVSQPNKDHFEVIYTKLYRRLPGHRLDTRPQTRLQRVTSDQCARRCVAEDRFTCHGFNYSPTERICSLNDAASTLEHGVVRSDAESYYQQISGEFLPRFINFGEGHLSPIRGSEVYQKAVSGVTLEECASRCLSELQFHCQSFDYSFTGRQKTCSLSKYIAANVNGLVTRTRHVTNHYERIGPWLSHFYPRPYSRIDRRSRKTHKRVTTERCARLCAHEETFVCRSFDYIMDAGTCLLSEETHDILRTSVIGRPEHHFEMKPISECGGELSTPQGDFASPNWPNSYHNGERCSWTITVANDKVIRLRVTQLDLGPESYGHCSAISDRLVFSQGLSHMACGSLKEGRTFVSKGNKLQVMFISNHAGESGRGFRAFYTEAWSCDVSLKEPSELASPSWPDTYPPSSRCWWRITAPPGHRVYLHFKKLDLHHNELGHCMDALDHVAVWDGLTTSDPAIGLYCGKRQPFSVRSSGRKMLVRFSANGGGDERGRRGFHAETRFEAIMADIIPVVPTPGSEVRDQRKPIPLDETTGADDGLWYRGVIESDDGGYNDETSGTFSCFGRTLILWAVIAVLLCAVVACSIVICVILVNYRRQLSQAGIVKTVIMEKEVTPTKPPRAAEPLEKHNNQPQEFATPSAPYASVKRGHRPAARSESTKDVCVKNLVKNINTKAK